MKNLTFTILILAFLFILHSCKEEHSVNDNAKTSDAEMIEIITKEVDSLYKVYERFDYGWMEFFAENYAAIYPDSKVQHMTRDSLISQWKRIYSKYEVQLLDRGRPTIIPSEDMAISYNTFHEIFINKETRDTSDNTGTYIVTWKKQADGSWKIVFETLQNHE
ncbi:MAG: hypothetical protein KDC24_03770 [Saprospiraceae bacterium]|nr:hypothetical protein [Saprospiraceae bacterium]